MAELDPISLAIGDLTRACDNLQKGHEDIQKTNADIYTVMRGMNEKLSTLAGLPIEVKSLSEDVSKIKIENAKRKGYQMAWAGAIGASITVFAKRAWESIIG